LRLAKEAQTVQTEIATGNQSAKAKPKKAIRQAASVEVFFLAFK
jgi:hypothetical protein